MSVKEHRERYNQKANNLQISRLISSEKTSNGAMFNGREMFVNWVSKVFDIGHESV